jgi:hypothetical protein
MPKSKKYRKKPRGYKRKLANAPQHAVYNRHKPPRIGYAYNRTLSHPDYTAFYLGNIRYQDREHLESLERLKDRNGTLSRSMAENFKAIESAYYTGSRWKIGAQLRGIKEHVDLLTKAAPRKVSKIKNEGVSTDEFQLARGTVRDMVRYAPNPPPPPHLRQLLEPSPMDLPHGLSPLAPRPAPPSSPRQGVSTPRVARDERAQKCQLRIKSDHELRLYSVDLGSSKFKIFNTIENAEET